jgi:ERF superfamily
MPTTANTYTAALAAFQAELPRIRKDAAAIIQTSGGGTYGYKYADLGAIVAIAMPLLGKHGLSFTAFPRISDNGFVLHYRLRHASGDGDEGDWPLPDPIRTKPQVVGSAITYARRYTFCAAIGIAPDEEDDDGKDASDGERAEYVPETRADGSATEAEQARMNRGPVPGTERLKATPEDDPFYDVAKAIDVPKEELPGTASRDQLNQIFGLFDKLGYPKDDRDGRLTLTREIVGRDIKSSAALSMVEATALKKELEERVPVSP